MASCSSALRRDAPDSVPAATWASKARSAGGRLLASPEYGDTINTRTLARVRYGAWLSRASGLPILVSGGTEAVVSVGGLGLDVHLSAHGAELLPVAGEPVRLWTHLAVREDSMNSRRPAASFSISSFFVRVR